MKIAFALIEHLPNDDRVWHQQSQALFEHLHEIFFVVATSNPLALDKKNVFCFEKKMPRRQQIGKFSYYLSIINPDIIICDNPVSVLGANRYKKKEKKRQLKIYYDITEWYPSKSYFHHHSKIKNILKFPLLCGISFYVSWLVSGFIFGEYYKAIPYKLFFWKRNTYLTYYADLESIKTYPIKDISKACTLFYAGLLSKRYGFYAVLDNVKQVAQKFPETDFKFCIYSKDEKEMEIKVDIPNLKIDFHSFTPFPDFCREFGEADIFFDLREIDWETSRSLPIKLFYYMAAGRPVVYSDLKAIRRGVPEINEFGVLVNPENTEDIVRKISQYIENKELYQKHCLQARQLAENRYNWENIKKTFIDFIEKA
jgi:glycosyltransferase involved in cell wall biosynthesis